MTNMTYMFPIIILGILVTIINIYYAKWQIAQREKEGERLTAISGDYKGQTHNIDDWRKIAIDIAKCTKNSKLNAMAKYGTDEDVIGMLYVNFGVELIDETN